MTEKEKMDADHEVVLAGLKDPRLGELASDLATTMVNLMLKANFSPAAMMVAIGVATQMARKVAEQQGVIFDTDLIMHGISLGMHQTVIAVEMDSATKADLSSLPEELRAKMRENLDKLPPELRDRVGAALGVHPKSEGVH